MPPALLVLFIHLLTTFFAKIKDICLVKCPKRHYKPRVKIHDDSSREGDGTFLAVVIKDVAGLSADRLTAECSDLANKIAPCLKCPTSERELLLESR